MTHSNSKKNYWREIIFPVLKHGTIAAVILLLADMMIPLLGLTGVLQVVLEKVFKVLLIGVLGWIAYEVINGAEKIIFIQYETKDVSELTMRRIKTQVLILKRIILTILSVVVFSAILLVFDSVRQLGAGILTTATVLSAIGAFAAQQSLSRLFAGLYVAFTQPASIGDTVIIDNELGTIEDISLAYVVIKLWNLRRLILPTEHLIQKGFQNLSRISTQLLEPVFLYVDFTLPVDVVREKFFEFIEASKFWDRQVKAFHVTAIKESTMELRALMSAADSGTLWELECEMREKLMDFIVKNYPECLPKQRQMKLSNDNSSYDNPAF